MVNTSELNGLEGISQYNEDHGRCENPHPDQGDNWSDGNNPGIPKGASWKRFGDNAKWFQGGASASDIRQGTFLYLSIYIYYIYIFYLTH